MIRVDQDADIDLAVPFDVRDRGLLLADGIFDTSKIASGRVVLFEKHLSRLERDANAIGLNVSPSRIRSFMEKSISDTDDAVLRLTVTRGPHDRGLEPSKATQPTIIAMLSPNPQEAEFASMSLQLSAIIRNSSSPISRHKTLAYTDTVIAQITARQAGFDDSVFLNFHGNVCCAGIGNLFAQFGDEVWTPPIDDGVLAGTMREWLIESADQIGISIKVKSFTLEELKRADRVFLSNSVRLFAPISKIDETPFRPELPSGLEEIARQLVEGCRK